MAKISVIVPCFNQAKFLDETLRSVLDQTYSNWECIIVNDGSDDNTKEIAQKWCAVDSRFIYYSKENGGLSSARNFAISKASGYYILPLDSDDKIGAFYLQKAMNAFEEDNTLKLVYCQASFFGAKEGDWVLAPYSFPEILTNNMIFCTSFFKKDDFIAVGGYNECLKFGLEDWDLWLRLLSSNDKVYKIPEILFFYRKHHGTSMSDQFIDENRHNISMNMVFDLNRKLYNSYFGDPITVALNAVKYKNKIAKIEKSTLFKLIVKIENTFRKIKRIF